MYIKSCTTGFILFGLVLLGGNAWAAASVIEGIVKDANGRPIKSAEVRIEAAGTRNATSSVITDATGHYTCDCLGAGASRVSVIVNGVRKISVGNVKATLGEATKLNFEFKKSPPGRKGHYVWVESATGSHLGGRWVEVDEQGYADTGGFDHLERKSGALMKQLQDNAAASNGR